MGKFNSSLYVVRPVFNEIVEDGKLEAFLKMVLPDRGPVGDLKEIRYNGKLGGEKVLPPNSEFLKWCRRHPESLKNPDLARARLDSNENYKFEGGTHPDIYIKTSTLTVVIEAKWTEPRITSHTTWRKEGERDQLIRHMDALVPFEDSESNENVYGLFIIDGNGKISKSVLESLFQSDWYFMKSLPHRIGNGSFKSVMAGFCGVYTWQAIKRELNLANPCS